MSRTFTRFFLKTLKDIASNDTRYEINKNNTELWFKLLVITTGLTGHGVYALSTTKKDSSIVVKKYKMVRNGFTEFMIIDDKGRHFNVNNSLWYWKWNSVEDWCNIKEGDKLYFKYYGWRMPFLGLFPNIIMSNKTQFLDSISSSEFHVFETEKLI
jgi:hypothetical protein